MANKTGIDQGALIEMFAQATAKQGEALRQAVGQATLGALQGRELTLKNIRGVVKTVTEAASTGASQSSAKPPEIEAMLVKAFEGMDAALLQAVEANRKALQQFVGQGVGLQQDGMKSALANLEKMEDTFFASVRKAAEGAGAPLQGPWSQVLDSMKLKGTDTGAQAALTVEQVMSQAQTALRDSRALGLRTSQVLMDSYAALVSGVLIGMSEGLQGGKAEAAPTAARRR